jgi:uncharacterized protein (TIGR00299 family) protein
MSSPSSPESRAPLPAPTALAIHLDLVGGISGDMFVAAMTDALAALGDVVLAELRAAHPDGGATPAFRGVTRGGLRARGFGLVRDTIPRARRVVAHAHRGTSRAHGTSYAELRTRIERAPLAAATRTHALALLALLGDAEAHVHGIDVADVHFHELADWDSLLDIVGAAAIAGALEGAQWSASAPPQGRGTVRTAHGVLPVPAPATCRLLEGYPWRDDGIEGERVTPTGAAILRHLVPASACATVRASGKLVASGYGAGVRELDGTPNVLRALVFERTAATAAQAVALLEFDIDDMSGEEIALAAERLRAHAGVVDLTVGTRAGKKGRTVSDFRILARLDAADTVAQACFVETSTLGLRVREERRHVLARAEVAAAVGDDVLQVKVAERPGGRRTAKAAHDDVAAKAGLATRRRLRAAGEKRALRSRER